MEKSKFSRKELYELVSTKPLTTIAAEYSISAIKLKKACIDMNVPIPPNGHWSKLKFGKLSELNNLPIEHDSLQEIDFNQIKNTKKSDSLQTVLQKMNSTKEDMLNLFNVPKRLTNPDNLIVNTINYYEAVKKYDWRSNKPHPERIEVLNIDTSKETEPRAYRIMDTIIKLLCKRNHSITFRNYSAYAVIFGEQIPFRLREKNKVSSEKDSWGSRKLEPTGKLAFIIGESFRQKEVQDGFEPLESKIPKIISILEEEGERERQWRIQSEIQRQQQEEKRKKEQERKQLIEIEVKKFKNLFLDANRLHQANIMMNYINILEENANNNNQMSNELKEWLVWAKKKVEWYNPLINAEDPILNNDIKMSIFKLLMIGLQENINPTSNYYNMY
ncbi:MAG: hypothetical protein NTZ33_05110 [Bacteroidetes bacterium]|nr:hypothetical protein [Bacteroidota bacterium]